MFKPAQYRAKASEYCELANTSTGSEQKRDFQKLEQRFAVLADNEQWLADNYQNTVHAEQGRSFDETLADEEERILRCLGAALIMQWNTLPTKLQRELFDNAGNRIKSICIKYIQAGNIKTYFYCENSFIVTDFDKKALTTEGRFAIIVKRLCGETPQAAVCQAAKRKR